MIAIVGLLLLALVVGGALVLKFGRTWVLDQAATEARLTGPETHTVSYRIPNGQDPATLIAALAHAHFATAINSHDGVERLLIACDDADRAQVREVLETHLTSPVTTPRHLRFDDEPAK